MRYVILLSIGWWGFFAFTTTRDQLAFGAVQPDPASVTNSPFARLARAIRSDPDLEGAWVVREAVPVDKSGQYSIRIIVDKRHSERQNPKIHALIRQFLPDRSVHIAGVVQLPLSQLTAKLNTEIEAQRDLDGSYVMGAYFVQSRFGFPLLELYGRVPDEECRIRITDMCGDLLEDFWHWRNAVDESGLSGMPRLRIAPNASGQELKVTASVSSIGRVFYSDALEAYWCQRYDAAAQLFRIAMLESPDELAYRYWRILAEHRGDLNKSAYDHMVSLTRRGHPSQFRKKRVALSLERVQGPTRMTLRKMEVHAQAKRPFSQVRGEF